MTTSTPTLTAGQVAQYIQRPGEPLGAAIARFRNWEKTGIIKAVGDANPGTGRKKRYSALALVEAILLQALVDGVGAPAISMRPLIKQIPDVARRAARDILEGGYLQKSGKRELADMMIVTRTLDSDNIAIGTSDHIGKYMSTVKSPIHILIDLKTLFSQLPKNWEQEVKEEVLAWAQKRDSIAKKSK